MRAVKKVLQHQGHAVESSGFKGVYFHEFTYAFGVMFFLLGLVTFIPIILIKMYILNYKHPLINRATIPQYALYIYIY